MFSKSSNNWPKGFKDLEDFPAFEAFASALWENQAAVMIGAGFSKFCKREKNAPSPPIWKDFKHQMESALGYQTHAGPDSLRLAEEYRTQHGEHGLDNLIRSLVADEQWEPGDLHKELLEFPWQDVLTTNWDTLLERTKQETPDQIYSCVQTVQDIARQSRPRIVKLHGSMPSHKPFIFTEEEFRTYPTNFAPFVNLAQQVMLENELCLLGFSGDDPNFLEWNGWVRDTLGLSSRRIRLVGVLNLSSASRATLKDRNVTPIDLSPLVRGTHRDDKHAKAMRIFFQALRKSKPPSSFSWQLSEEHISVYSGVSEDDSLSTTELAKIWNKDRQNYPGWVIPPFWYSRKLLDSPRPQVKDQSAEALLRFAAERIWRREVAGVWQFSQDLETSDKNYDSGQNHLSSVELVNLCSSAAKYWRRVQEWPAWNTWMERLSKIESEDARLTHSYEMAQKAILDWDDEAVLSHASAIDSAVPIWMMRKAGLMAKVFCYQEASDLYQAALKGIRTKQLAAPRSAWLISLEGWASMFNKVSQYALKEQWSAHLGEESEQTKIRFLGAKADPWDVISRLDNLASERRDRNRRESTPWKLNFRPGSYRAGDTTIRNHDDECPFYGLLEVMERVGAPGHIADFNIFSTRLENAYRAVTAKREADLMTFLASYRGWNKKALEWMLSRTHVARMRSESIEDLLVAIPRRIDRLLDRQDSNRAENHIIFLLEVLARIVVRADGNFALNVFKWAANMLDSRVLCWGYSSAFRILLEAALEPMNSDNKAAALIVALHMKTPREAGVGQVGEREWPEIIESFSKSDAQRLDTAHLTARISSLLDIVQSGETMSRTRAVLRLHLLYKSDLLTDTQIQQLEQAIWSRTNDKAFPADIDLFDWIFLDLPGKQNAKDIFINTVVNNIAEGEISSDTLKNLGGALAIGLEIGKDKLVSCLAACLKWKPYRPDRDHPLLRAMSHRITDDLNTGEEIGKLLATQLLPRLESDDIPEEMTKFFLSLETFKCIPYLVAAARQIERIWPDQTSFALMVLRRAIASRDPWQVASGFIAMEQYTKPDAKETENGGKVIEILLHTAEHRTQPRLSHALYLLAELLNRGDLNELQRLRVADTVPVILEEYRYDQDKLDVPALADLPLVRRSIHQLVIMLADDNPSLGKWVKEMRDDPLPEVRSPS